MTNEEDITPTPSETQPGETQPGATQPGATRPGATRPGETQPGETRPGETRPGQAQQAEPRPSAIQPSVTQPRTTRPTTGIQPSEPQPGEARPGAEAIDAAIRAKAEAEVDRRLLESSLVRLRATGHPLLRSMADDLLAGRVSMRELARTPGIAAPIQAAAQRYLRWRNSMSPAELQAISDDMAARVQWMRDQIALGWKKRSSDQPAHHSRDGERGPHPEQ